MIDLKRLEEVAEEAGKNCADRLASITEGLPQLLHFNPGGEVPPPHVQDNIRPMVAEIKERRKTAPQ